MKPVFAISFVLLVLAASAPASAGAAGYSLTVRADASSYTGGQTLTASGAVSPPPGNGTAVFLQIIGPLSESMFAVGSASVSGSTGSYRYEFVLGGSSSWVAGTYTLAASWGSSSSNTISAMTSFAYTPAAAATGTTSQAPSNSVRVSMLNGSSADTSSPGYSPAAITVVIGVNNTVTWTNSDVAIHTVTASDKSFDSGDVLPGATFSFTFKTPGIYTYHCIYHEWMSGTVTVKAAVGGATSTASSSSPTQSVSTTTSSQTSGGGVPEFPFQLLVASAFTALIITSYLLARRRQASGGLIGSATA